MNRRMRRDRLNIGTYIFFEKARTEEHIKDLADCGIDYVLRIENDRKALDLFEKYGVGVITTDIIPHWWGGDGADAGKLEAINPPESYVKAAASYVDHPAVWAHEVGDEPSALDFPYYAKVIEQVEQLFPNQFAYLNLYPNYASVAQNNAEETVNQLGTATYEEHIQKYCENIPMDYLCYDFYVYSIDVPKAYDNLITVADACLRTGRGMWIVLQVNSFYPEKWISTNQLRFQAYTAMAFGTENIAWACYTPGGWWHNQVLDENCNKTQQYDKLKTVNAELHALSEMYMKYRRVSTHFVGFEGTSWLEGVKQAPIPTLNTGIFKDVHADGNEALVIGEMAPKNDDGSRALFICAADDPEDVNPKSYQVLFRADGREITALTGNGKLPVTRLEDGSYSIPVQSNMGVLVVAR